MTLFRLSHLHLREHLFARMAGMLVAGGTGGLGREIIRWMAGSGAKRIIAISRSGEINQRSVELSEEMASAGVILHIRKLDMTDTIQVRNVLELTGGKPVSGIIQGAMVLNVSY